MVVTWKEALAESEARGIAMGEARGIAMGEARGIAMGEARSKVEATREAIEIMVGRRFGSVPDRVKERLAAVSELPRLYDLLEAIADSRSPAQVEAALGLRPAGAS